MKTNTYAMLLIVFYHPAANTSPAGLVDLVTTWYHTALLI